LCLLGQPQRILPSACQQYLKPFRLELPPKKQGQITVIFYHKYLLPPRNTGRKIGTQEVWGRFRHVGRGKWESKAERRTFARLTLNPYLPTEHLHEHLDNREPQPRAFSFLDHRVISSVEAIEDPADFVRRDAYPRVANVRLQETIQLM
jgi:hypothetical protein